MKLELTMLSLKPRPGRPSFGFFHNMLRSWLGRMTVTRLPLEAVFGLLPGSAAKPSWKPFKPGCRSGDIQRWFFGLRGIYGLLGRFSEGLALPVWFRVVWLGKPRLTVKDCKLRKRQGFHTDLLLFRNRGTGLLLLLFS